MYKNQPISVTFGNNFTTSTHPCKRHFNTYVIVRPFVKTVRPVLSDRCMPDCLPMCLSCNVGVLWPNGWMDQDATW